MNRLENLIIWIGYGGTARKPTAVIFKSPCSEMLTSHHSVFCSAHFSDLGAQLALVRSNPFPWVDTHMDERRESVGNTPPVAKFTLQQYTAVRSEYGYTAKFGGCWQDIYYSDYIVTVYV